MPDNVVLIGFSGTGKSSIGRALAARLQWPLVDTDDLIVSRFEKCIAAIFREDGEAVFRVAERDAVAAACAGRHQVISLGGGAPVDLESRAKIRDRNWVVRLEASPEVILHRLRTSPGAEERPMLAGTDPLGRIRSLLAARADAYGIADFAINTEGRSVEGVVEEIVKSYLGVRGQGSGIGDQG